MAGRLRGDYCIEGITGVQVWADSVRVLAKMEPLLGNGSRGEWVLLLNRRDQKYTYSFVTQKELADWSDSDSLTKGGAHKEMQRP